MRLFIAISFDPPVLDALTAAQTSLKKNGVRGGFTARQNLHMTLVFLGEVRDPRPVIAALERITLPQSTMTFEKTEMFRDILVCTFRPHVTLVRRAFFPDGRAERAPLDADIHALEIPVRRVCLMRTDFIDGRPKYSCMKTIE